MNPLLRFDHHHCTSIQSSFSVMGMELPTRQTPADQVRELMTRKDAIEAQIEAQASILRANNCTMQTPLVDAEGFPRADIDIYEVRHARVRLIELRNDHKAVTDAIYKGLQGVYDPSLPASAPEPTAETLNSSELRPFAKVDGVAPGSPAAAAVSISPQLSFAPLTPFPGAIKRRSYPFVRGFDALLLLSKFSSTSRNASGS